MCVYQMNAVNSHGRGIQHMADSKPNSFFFHFRSPEVMGCWLLLRVTAPCGVCWYWPNHHRAPLEHGASLERVPGRNCFFTLWHGFADWNRKKVNFFIPLKGYKTLVNILKGFSKLSHIGKNQHSPGPVQAGSRQHPVPHSVHDVSYT